MKTQNCKACGRKVVLVRNHAGQQFALDATAPVFTAAREGGGAAPASGCFVDHGVVCRPRATNSTASKRTQRRAKEQPGILTHAEMKALEHDAMQVVKQASERSHQAAQQRQAAADRLEHTGSRHENHEGWTCQVCNATWSHVHHACACRACGATGWFDLMVRDHVCPGTKQRSGSTRPAADNETW